MKDLKQFIKTTIREFLNENDNSFKLNLNDKNLNKMFSSNKEEIIQFLNDLPDKITLYRGLIIPKGEKSINKKKLGIHWSLDEYFVKNMFEYDTFKIGSEREDYNLWVITAVFNKSDIDYEGTLDKRLIKDTGFFWDELTGEMIQNDSDDIKQHPYSHEDEILVNPNSNPKIIKIEKIKL